MKILDLLIGKKVLYTTDAKIDVELEIKKVEEDTTYHTRQITPDTPENDWWGDTSTTSETSYYVEFTNGFSKRYNSLNSIRLIQ